MPTLIFLPGLVSDAIVWQAAADALPAGAAYRIADLSGSDSIGAMAAQALAEAEGPLVLVGHSMGGRVAMEAARQAPDRVAGLVLANTGHGPLAEGERVSRERKIALGYKDMNALAAEWLPPMVAPDRQGDEGLMAELTAMVLRAGPDVHERQIRALIGRPDAGAYLPDIACPILLVAASEDGWSPILQHEEIAAMAPDAELAVIEGAGHFAPVEAPGAVSAAINGWLARRKLL